MENNENNTNGAVLGNVVDTPNNQNPMPSMSTPSTGEVVTNEVAQPTGVPGVQGMPETLSTPTNDGQVLNNSQVMTGATNTVVNQPAEPVVGSPSVEMTPPVQNTPNETPVSYTNPQTIMPEPVPSFESSNQIGQTPPLSLEPEKKPKRKKGKFFVILLVLIILGGIGYGIYYVLTYTDLLTKKEKVTIKVNDLSVNVGDSLSSNLSDYATISGTDSKNCYKDTTDVDLSKAGTYNYSVTCGKISKKGKITVIDNSSSESEIETKTLYKAKGDTITASEFAVNSDYTFEFVDSEDENITSKDPGTYTVKLKATKDDKSETVEGKVIILSSKLKGYVACTSEETSVESSDKIKMTKTERIGILDDGKNTFASLGQVVYTFVFEDTASYNEYQTKYNNGEQITINNISGVTNFGKDANNKSAIMITNDRDGDSIVGDYGEDNVKDFASIMKYFGGEGYKCAFEKAE